nr:Zn-dependent hydrolase [Anaerolineae bacterium]
MNNLRINSERMLDDLNELAQIGATPEGGVHRPALSDADLAAREWFTQKARAEGFSVQQDGAGNVSARLLCGEAGARTVMCGSHLDSVPHGGRFDGALGVVAGLEALRTVRDSSLSLPVHLEVMSFTDEEGTWIPLMGSQALTGNLTTDKLASPRGGLAAFDARLAAAGTNREQALTASRDPQSIKAWVEVHIEQGSRLEEAGRSIGVVTGIVGISSYWLNFLGRADHAGTTPMDRRLDAMRGVAEFVQQSRELVMNRFPAGVVNCGCVRVEPGAFNIVPERARVSLEFRHADAGKLDAMREALLNLALHVVEVEGLGVEVEQMGIHQPAPMHREVVGAIEQACDRLGLSRTSLSSYAGHDTQMMAEITQAGMFFVPSLGGFSHSYRENTPDEDCIHAGDVLLHTVLQLAASD